MSQPEKGLVDEKTGTIERADIDDIDYGSFYSPVNSDDEDPPVRAGGFSRHNSQSNSLSDYSGDAGVEEKSTETKVPPVETTKKLKEAKSSKKLSASSDSMMERMKKGLASRTVNTRMGRKAVSHFIGETGMTVVNAFKEVAKRDRDEVFAKDLKKSVMRYAVKAKILLDSKKLALNDFYRISTYSLEIMYGLHHVLTLPTDKEKQPYIEELSECFSQFCVGIVTLFHNHVKRQAVDTLRDTINYWGGRHFLTFLCTDPSSEAERVAIRNCLVENIKKRQEELGQTNENPFETKYDSVPLPDPSAPYGFESRNRARNSSLLTQYTTDFNRRSRSSVRGGLNK